MKVSHNLKRARRRLYRPHTAMPRLNHALSPNRHAIPLLVIRRHPSIRSIWVSSRDKPSIETFAVW
jgi:hypothetical protein